MADLHVTLDYLNGENAEALSFLMGLAPADCDALIRLYDMARPQQVVVSAFQTSPLADTALIDEADLRSDHKQPHVTVFCSGSAKDSVWLSAAERREVTPTPLACRITSYIAAPTVSGH